MPDDTPKQPQPNAVAGMMHPVAQAGMIACMGTIAGSALLGGVAYTRGKQHMYRQMVKMRMILAATAIGLYSSASGWLQPPQFLTDMVGREPRLKPLLSEPPTKSP